MKTVRRTLGCIVVLVLLAVLLTLSAGAYSVQTVEGTVNATEVRAIDLVLTGDTTLVLDKDLSLTSIRGNYALTVQDAGGHKLTVKTPMDEHTITSNGSGHAISVASFTSDANLNLTARKDALNIDQAIKISGGKVTIECGGDAIYSRKSTITIENAMLNITAEHGCIVAKDVTKEVYVDAGGSAKTSGESAYCVVGADVWLKGSPLTLSSVNNTVVSYGQLSIYGTVSATCTAKNSVALNARGDGEIRIGSGAKVTATGGSTALYALGEVNMYGDADTVLTATGNRDYGIRADGGDITLRGTVNVTAVGSAISAPEGWIIHENGTLTAVTTGSTSPGLSGGKGIELAGTSARVEAQANAIDASGDIFIRTELTAATYRENCVAINTRNRKDIYIPKACNVNVASVGAGIYSDRNILMEKGGTLTVRSYSQRGIDAKNEIRIYGTINVKSPKDCVNSHGSEIWIGGDVTLECTGEGYCGIRSYNEVTVDDESWISGGVQFLSGTVRVTSAGCGVRAGWSVSGFYSYEDYDHALRKKVFDLENKLTVQAGKESAIRVENGYIELLGTIALSNEEKNAVYVGRHATTSSEYGKEKVFIQGLLTVSADHGHGVYCPRIELDCSTGSYIHSYGCAICSEGEATLRGGNLSLISEADNVVSAKGDIKLAADSVEAVSKHTSNSVLRSVEGSYLIECPLTARSESGGRVFLDNGCGGIAITTPLAIVRPTRGYVEKKSAAQYSTKIIDPANPRGVVSEVEIGANPYVLEGWIEINKKTASVGEVLIYDIFNCPVGCTEISEWQTSDNGVNWTPVPGETRSTFRARSRDAGKYVRAKMTADTYAGELFTEPCFITETTALTGGIVYTSAARYTNPLSPAQTARTGDLAKIEQNNPLAVRFQWQRSEDKENWTDIKRSESASALDPSYDVGSESTGKYIRLTATVDGMTGVVVGAPVYVPKLAGILAPGNYPQLTTANPYTSVTVTNAKKAQEYLVTSGAASPKDWSSAITPDADGSLTLSCSTGQLVFVHTRVKETARRAASGSVYGAIYTGTAAAASNPKSLTFDKTRINTKVGAVTQLTVRPLPADFAGWDSYTLRWFSNNSSYVQLFADKDCTQPLTTEFTAQHTVWLKGVGATRYIAVGCEKQIGYNEIIHATCDLEIADADGNHVLTGVSFPAVTVYPGESTTVSYSGYPAPAIVSNLTLVKGDGIQPAGELEITVNDNGTTEGTLTVTAPENAALGTYYYEARVDGKKLDYISGIQITVADKTATVSFDPGNPGAKYYARPTLMATGMAPQTVPLGAEFILPENGFDAPDGYEFQGWDLGETGDGVSITQDTKVTAVWKRHEHTLQHVGATASVCTTPGHMEYWFCEDCGKLFGDANGLYPVDTSLGMAALMIPAPGHTPGEQVRENEIAATCTTEGSCDLVTYCTVCGEVVTREYSVEPALGHMPGNIEQENEIAPTCTEDGHYESVVRCTVCGEEISRDETNTPMLGHNFETVLAVTPTCTQDGNPEYVTCTRCGGIFDAMLWNPIEDHHDVELEAFGHDLVHHDAQAPTETTVGWNEYDTCTRCDYTTYVEIPAGGALGVPGDLNGDGTVNAKDVTYLRRALAGGYGISPDVSVGDVNKDGALNAKDVTYLRRALAGGYGITLG